MTNLRALCVLLILPSALKLISQANAVTTGCYKSQSLYPKLVFPANQKGQTKITAMAVTPDPIACVGGFTFQLVSNSQQEFQFLVKSRFYAFIGCYTHSQRWNWRAQVSGFPEDFSDKDPIVAALAIKRDNLSIAALFISKTAAEGKDAYIAEYSIDTGIQTSRSKLKLPTLAWASPQSMLYLDDSKKTLIVVLTTKPNTLSKCVIAAIDFSKKGSAQAKLIQLSDVDQLPSHLAYTSIETNNEFFIASNLDFMTTFNGNQMKKNGLRIVRYRYDSATNSLSAGSEKVHISHQDFPNDFSQTSSPIFTAFKFNKGNNRLCGGARLRNTSDENVWIFDFKITDQTLRAANNKRTNQQMTVLDCNAEDTSLFFIASIQTTSSVRVVLSKLVWTNDVAGFELKHTIFLEQVPEKLLGVTVGYIKGENTENQGFFAVSTKNPYNSSAPDYFNLCDEMDQQTSCSSSSHTNSRSFKHSTAALYYSNTSLYPQAPKACIEIQQSEQQLRVFQDEDLKAQQENAGTFSAGLSTQEFSQVITDSTFEQQVFDLELVIGEDLCLIENNNRSINNYFDGQEYTLTVTYTDYALKSVSLGTPVSVDQCSSLTFSQFYYYIMTDLSNCPLPALPKTTNYYFDSKNAKMYFQLSPDYDAESTKEFTLCVGVTDPRGVPYGERLGPIKVKIIIEKKCFADLNNITTTQAAISNYHVNEDGLKTYYFNQFTINPADSACTFTYTLKMLKNNAERSEITEFALNDDKTTFTFNASQLKLDWSQQNVYNSSGNYIFELKGTLPDVGTKTVDINFTIVMTCKGSEIKWVGSSEIFTNIAYTLLDSSTDKAWTWTSINDEPPKQIDKIQPSGVDCGPVTLLIMNEDTTPMDSSIFSYDQTSFSVGASNLIGTATAKTYRLAVFFMYLDTSKGNSGTHYYTWKKPFDVDVTDPCSAQTLSDIDSFTDFTDFKYYFGEDLKTIEVASRIQFRQAFCPWRPEIEFLDLAGNPKTKSTAVTLTEIDALSGKISDKIEIFKATTQPDAAAEGVFKVRVSYKYGYSYSTQQYNQSKQVEFKLELVTCANLVAEKSGLDGSSHTYFMTNSALLIDVRPQVSDPGCAYTVSMSDNVPSTIFTLQSQADVNVHVGSHDTALMARYTVRITYSWNQDQSSREVSFVVTVSDLCQDDLQPLNNRSLTYKIMKDVVTQSLEPTKTLSYCDYVLEYLSGSNATLDTLLTKEMHPPNANPKIKLEQATYNASTVGEYRLRFRYSWSFEQTRELEITIIIEDECQTKLNTPASPIILEYKLLDDASIVDLTPPIDGNQYCIFTIRLETNPITSLLAWTDFEGTNLNPIHAQVQSSSYVRSRLGNFSLRFNYAWSLNNVASVTVNLKVSDKCQSVVSPLSPPLLQYFLMRPKQEVLVRANIDSSAAYCTYDVSVISVIKQASSSDVKSNSIWVWTDRLNLTKDDAIMFGVFQNPYDSSMVDDYTVKLRFFWSEAETLDVTLDVKIMDDCVAKIILPTISDKQYTILNAQLQVDATPQVESGYEFCDYSSRVTITKAGSVITDPALTFTAVTKGQVSSRSVFGVQQSPATLPSSLTGFYDVQMSYSVSNRGFDQHISFMLEVRDPCLSILPVATELTRQVYKMNAPLAKLYTFSPYTFSLSRCTLNYSFSSTDNTKTNLFMTLDGTIQTFRFESGSMTFAHLGEYTVTVTGENNSDSSQKATASFIVEVVKQLCEDTEFRFQEDVFVNRTYDFPLTPVVYQWIPPLVQVVDTTERQCGPLNIDIYIMKDSEPVLLSQSDYSKLLRVDLDQSTLTVSSENNRGDIGTHQLVIKAWYTNYLANGAQHSFRVTVDESICRNSKISTLGIQYENGSDIGDSIIFYIDDSPLKLNVNFITEIKQCPLVSLTITSNASNLERVIQIVNYRNLRQLKFSNAPSKDVSLLIGKGASTENEGFYDITLTATSGRSISVSFRLQIANNCSAIVKTPKSPKNLAYTSGDKAMIVTWEPFTHNMKPTCNPKLEYSLSTKNIVFGQNFPSGLIEFQPFLNRMIIHGAFAQSGTFLVQVKAELNDVTKAVGSFDFLIQLSGLPGDHSAILTKPLVLIIPKGVSNIQSPKFLADDITSFDVEISDQTVDYNATDNSWVISNMWDRQEQMEIEATLIFRSSLRPGLTQSQTFKILLSPEIDLDQQDSSINRRSWINTYTPKTSKKRSITPPIFVIENIDSHSFVTLTCNKLLNRTWDWNQTFLEGAFNLTVRPGLGQDEANVAFVWDYVNFHKRKLLLRLNFTQPLLISQALTFDFLEVRTNATLLDNLFYDLEGIPFRDNQTLERYIPLQLKQEVATMIISDSIIYVKSSTSAIVIGSFVLNLLLAGSLSFLWGMINALQFIVHFPLVNVYFPANARLFFKTIITIATFKIFNTEQLIDFFDNNILKKVGQADEITPLFAEGGFKSTSILRNMGIVALAAIVVIALVLLLLLFYKLLIRCACGQSIIRVVWLRIFWRAPIRYALESYLGFAIATLISYQVQTWGSWPDTLNSLSNIAMLSALCFLPVYITYFLTKNFGWLENEDFYSKFNALYFNIDVRYEFNVLFHTVFCIRRMIFALLITLLNPYPAFQIMILLHLSCFTMSYVAFNQPFKVNLLNSLELFNEIIILVMTYHLIMFSDFVKDREAQYKIGYSVCAFTALSITINLVFLVSTVTIAIHLKFKDRIKAWFARQRLRNQQIRQKKRDQLTQELKKLPKIKVEQLEQISINSRETASKIMFQDCDSPELLLVPSTVGKWETFDTNMESERSARNTQRSSVESNRSIQPRQSYNTSSFKPNRTKKSMEMIRDFRVAKGNLRLANDFLRVEKE